jgi:hypothetical protein
VAIPVSYTIVEYSGTDFQFATQQEKGVGSLTLGASITATTLARTTVQQTATGMSMGTPTYNTAGPSAITIATAANVLVFVGASASDLVACSPYFNTTLGSTYGALPVNVGTSTDLGTTELSVTSNTDNYHIFEWRVPMLAKRARVRVTAGASGTSRMYGRLYAVGADARPTKLLYDFGTFVGNNILNTVGTAATSATGSGFYMSPGEYFMDITTMFTAGAPMFRGFTWGYNTGRLGASTSFVPILHIRATSASTAAGDPANVTGLAGDGDAQLFFGISTT